MRTMSPGTYTMLAVGGGRDIYIGDAITGRKGRGKQVNTVGVPMKEGEGEREGNWEKLR